MSELKPCAPTNDELNEAFDLGYQACLHDNEKLTWDAAEELQQYRRAQPANEPLTLEQLREMDGEPVWVVCGIYKDWRIPEFIDEGGYKGFIKFTDRSAEPISDYGKNWLAYRRPPEMFIGVDLASGHDFTAYGRPPERSGNDG
jgi:hypothetical protein